MSQRRLIAWIVLTGLAVVMGIGAVARAETPRAIPGEVTPDPASLEETLNRIVENDRKILARFDALLEELKIVKIRATRKRRQSED